MPRLSPTPATVKKLFALSGNKCAFPGCLNNIVDSGGNIIGQICHIEAAEQGGQRFNPNSDDEYRRSFENLMLFCSIHHTVTNDTIKYPSKKLLEIKATHEAVSGKPEYSASEKVIHQAIDKYMNQENSNQGTGGQINNQAHNQNIGTQIGTQHVYINDKDDKSTDIQSSDTIRPVKKNLQNQIDKLKQNASPPKEDVIDFKNDMIIKRPSLIYELPVKALKYRKENGRIKADVESHEKLNGLLNEESEDTQTLLKGFLEKNDPDKKEVLKQQIKHKGQLQPAIITCDGFLINGNRRKMILEELYEDTHQDPKYENMRVVILPDSVSIFDIKRIENRYQMQDEGKSDYLGLNRALTLRENIKDGYSLQAQILDDPQFADKKDKDLQAITKEFEKKYLNPLKCVDKYLATFNREGLYNTISESSGDKEGRWQAFIDYSNFYSGTLENKSKLLEYKIKETEVGKIENAIFKIIRKRSLNSKELESSIGKVHDFVRKAPKYLRNPEAKKFLLKIADDVKEDIPDEMKYDKAGKKFDERDIDELWGNHFKKPILSNLMQAHKVVANQQERDKPLELLEDALKKLKHDNLKIESMDTSYYDKAMELTKEIVAQADAIYEAIDHARYNLKQLGKKKKS